MHMYYNSGDPGKPSTVSVRGRTDQGTEPLPALYSTTQSSGP
jgi:hypothetical protein